MPLRHRAHKGSSSFQVSGGRVLLGLLLSSTIGLLAYRRRSLTGSGIAGAIITGTTTVGLGGWPWGLSLIYFFLSSSLLSHFRSRQKEATSADKFSKGSQRDLAQAIANGGVASAFALTYGLSHNTALRSACEAGYVGALATAAADTWATELGVLSSTPPRLVTTGQITTPGTSGGVTPLGTVATVAGAGSLGLCYSLLTGFSRSSRILPLIALFSGLIGSLSDSLLGATLQTMYFCPTCQKETERRIHNCGTRTQVLRGWPWLNNDVVNLLSTFTGSLVAILLHTLYRGIYAIFCQIPFGRLKQLEGEK